MWGDTGWDGTPTYSTTATVQSFDDFVEITLPSSGTYTLRLPAGCNTASGTVTVDSVSVSCASGGETVTLTAYYMAKYQVTNANWKAYCTAKGITSYPSYWSGGGYPEDKENCPVLFVSYTEAEAYCAWLTEYLDNGYTFYVPSEGEWEWAALGDNTTYLYPWGTSAVISYNSSTGAISSYHNCNAVCTAYVLNSGITTLSYYDDTVVTQGTGYDADTDTGVLSEILSMTSAGSVTGWQYDSSDSTADNYSANADFANSDQFEAMVYTWGAYTTDVGSYENGKSWSGCYDMSGNCHEWTSTVGLAENGIEAGTYVNIVRGGSWYAGSNTNCIMRGEGRSPSGKFNSVGLRIAAKATS
ncbi:MAG: formylglycine-generating enzyme family protein [Pseudoxanthomonas sp.]